MHFDSFVNKHITPYIDLFLYFTLYILKIVLVVLQYLHYVSLIVIISNFGFQE